MTIRVYPVGDPAEPPDEQYDIRDDADWRAVHGLAGADEGILDDTTGGALRVTAGTDGNSVVIAPGRARVRNVIWETDAPVTLPIAGGVTSGNARVDAVVLRYQGGASDPAQRIIATVRPGTIAADASAVMPTISRVSTAHELLLGSARRAGVAAVTPDKVTDLRSWAVRLVMREERLLLSSDPIGTVQLAGGAFYIRRLIGGTVSWTGGSPSANAKIGAADQIPLPVADRIVALPLQANGSGDTFVEGGVTCDGSTLQLPTAGAYDIAAAVRFLPPSMSSTAVIDYTVLIYAGSEVIATGRATKSGGTAASTTVNVVAKRRLAAGTRLGLRVQAGLAGAKVAVGLIDSSLSVTYDRP